MMPDLGKYAVSVLSAYAVTIVLLAVLIAVSWLQSRSARARLDELESRKAGSGD